MDNQIILLEDFLDKHALYNNRIYLFGDIDILSAHNVVRRIDYLRDKSVNDVYIVIHSNGGDLDGELAITDSMMMLRENKINVHTTVSGMAYSAAATILAMGTPGCRSARPNASIMLHPCSYALDSDYQGNQERISEFIKKKNQHMMQRIATACKISAKRYKKFLADVDKGLWLSAEEAKNYGVIDFISYDVLPRGEIAIEETD
jgi:ATP-dependent Clp protease, protease subunit